MIKFELSKKEEKAAKKFIKEKSKESAFKGARFVFEFCVTGIGNTVIIKDNVTNTKLNITDYDMW
jgi:hypothetical protein